MKKFGVIAYYGYPSALPNKVFEVEIVIQDAEGTVLDSKRWFVEGGLSMDAVTDEMMQFCNGIDQLITISKLLEIEREKCPECDARTHRFMTKEQLKAAGYI